MKLRKLNNGYYSLYDSDGDIVASNNPNTPCSKRLSKQNCDEIFGVTDVEKLACDECHIDISAYKIIQTLESGKSKSELQLEAKVDGFKFGFNKAMELNKDKLFTVEDLYRAFLINSAGNNTTLRNFFEQTVLPMFEQPKEIEVEIVTHVDLAATPTDSRHPDAYLGTDTGIPFLDENGCLIIKKK